MWRVHGIRNELGETKMTTTKELRAIVEELELIDIGDAASYLGEYPMLDEEDIPTSNIEAFSLDDCTSKGDGAANG
jgi:hypothetical protein